ncbi:MAG: hypothetical protein ACFFAN_15030 [Promethearchaeota archaeon]
MLELLEKIKEKGITDDQRSKIYSLANRISKGTREEICPALLRVLLNSEPGVMKNELGRIIFHLQKNERITTMIGLQKLLEASLNVAPEELFKILETSEEDAKELAKNIKEIL